MFQTKEVNLWEEIKKHLEKARKHHEKTKAVFWIGAGFLFYATIFIAKVATAMESYDTEVSILALSISLVSIIIAFASLVLNESELGLERLIVLVALLSWDSHKRPSPLNVFEEIFSRFSPSGYLLPPAVIKIFLLPFIGGIGLGCLLFRFFF